MASEYTRMTRRALLISREWGTFEFKQAELDRLLDRDRNEGRLAGTKGRSGARLRLGWLTAKTTYTSLTIVIDSSDSDDDDLTPR